MRVEFGSQIILRLAKGQALSQATAGLGLEFVREFAPQLFILEARSVWNALVAAETLGLRDGVQVSHPGSAAANAKNDALGQAAE